MTIPIKNLQNPAGVGAGRLVGSNAGKAAGVNPTPNNTDGGAGAVRDSSGDQLTLTQRALRLNELTQSVKAQPTINQEKVDALREAIEEGRYVVNAERLAGKLMNAERML